MEKTIILLAAILATGPAATAEDAKPVRVVCWNIRRCVGMDHKSDMARTVAVIARQNPDVVMLQEVDQGTRRSSGVDQPAELAKLTGMQVVFGKAMPFDGGGYGLAILSKHPIKSSRVHPLPGKGEPRIAFEALIPVNGKDIRFINTHFDLDAGDRIKQAEALIKLGLESAVPTILAGDFNAAPQSPEILELAKHWRITDKKPPTLTIPADKPTEEIDYIFSKGFTQKDPIVVVDEPIASDHRPLSGQLLPATK